MGFDYFSYIVFSLLSGQPPQDADRREFSAELSEDYQRQRVYLQDRLLSALTIPRYGFSGTKALSRAAAALAAYGAVRPGALVGRSRSRIAKWPAGDPDVAGSATQQTRARAANETFFLWLAQTAHKTLREALISVNDDAIKYC
ncbi:hypothetical protein M8494_15605 [Serratia ureilytica]